MCKKTGYIGLLLILCAIEMNGCALKEPCLDKGMYYDEATETCQLLSERHCGNNGKIDCYDPGNKDQTLVSSWICDKNGNEYTCKIEKCKENADTNEERSICECKDGFYSENSYCYEYSPSKCGFEGKINCYDPGNKDQTLVLSWKCDKDNKNEYTCQIDECKEHATKKRGNCECDNGYYLDEDSSSCLPFDAEHCGYEKDKHELISCIKNQSDGASDVYCPRVGNSNEYRCIETCKDGYMQGRIRIGQNENVGLCKTCQSSYHKTCYEDKCECIKNSDSACGSSENTCPNSKAYSYSYCNINDGDSASCITACNLGYELINNECQPYTECNPQFIYDGNVKEDLGTDAAYSILSVSPDCSIELNNNDDDEFETRTLGEINKCYSKTSCPYSSDCKSNCPDSSNCESNTDALNPDTIFAALYSPGCPSGFICRTIKGKNEQYQYCDREPLKNKKCTTNGHCSNSSNSSNQDYFCAWNGTCQRKAGDSCDSQIVNELGIDGKQYQVCESQPLFCKLESVKNFLKDNGALGGALLDAYANDVIFSNAPNCNRFIRLRSFFNTNQEAQDICAALNNISSNPANTNSREICKSAEDLIRCHDLLYSRMFTSSLNIMADDSSDHTADIATPIRFFNLLREAYNRPDWQHIDQPSLCFDEDNSSNCAGDDKLYCECNEGDEGGTFQYNDKEVDYACNPKMQVYLQTCKTKSACIYTNNCMHRFCLDEPEYCTARVYWKVFENKDVLSNLASLIRPDDPDDLCENFENLVKSIKEAVNNEKLYDEKYCGKEDPSCKEGMLYFNCSEMFINKIALLPDWDVTFYVNYLNLNVVYMDKFDDWSGKTFKCPFK